MNIFDGGLCLAVYVFGAINPREYKFYIFISAGRTGYVSCSLLLKVHCGQTRRLSNTYADGIEVEREEIPVKNEMGI